MNINYDRRKINEALLDFYNATGINVSLLKEDFSPVSYTPSLHNDYCKLIHSTDLGRRACKCSDTYLLEKCKASGQIEYHVCHAGLIDAAIPVMYDNVILGYMILGQMKNDRDISEWSEHLKRINIDPSLASSYYFSLPAFDDKKIQSIGKIATMLVKYILLENMLNPKTSKTLDTAIDFINKNLEKDLSIQMISKETNISKSVLYKTFHSYLGCTVSEYINTKRIEHSVELLTTTDMTIEEISQRSGFISSSYYSRIFKKQKGLSPLNFRKESHL